MSHRNLTLDIGNAKKPAQSKLKRARYLRATCQTDLINRRYPAFQARRRMFDQLSLPGSQEGEYRSKIEISGTKMFGLFLCISFIY